MPLPQLIMEEDVLEDNVSAHPAAVRSNQLFRGMKDEEIERAEKLFRASVQHYAKGEFIHISGTPMTSFGLVLTGMVHACIDDINGNRVIMAEVAPGITFGESLCYLGVPDSPVYIYSTEETDIMWLSAGVLKEDSADPFCADLKRRFTSMLAARTLTMNSRIQVLSKISLRDKLVTYFSQLAALTGSLTFNLPFSRDDMATYMGANRSALSREMSAMKKEGLIDYYRNTVRILR